MKKLLLPLLMVVSFTPLANAQNVRKDDVAMQTVTQQTSAGTVSFLKPAVSTITVCSSAGTGIPCTPTVPICSSATDAVCSQPNPFTTDANGNYGFWVAPGRYVVTISGVGLTGKTITYDLPVGLTNTGDIASATQLQSTVATGTPPLIVTSTTVVPNLTVNTAATATNATNATNLAGPGTITGAYSPSGLFTFNAGLTVPLGQIALVNGALNATGGANIGKVNNTFYVDGIKYPKTNVGTQQALIDAYTQGGGYVYTTQGVTLDASLYSFGLINVTSGGAVTAVSIAGTAFNSDYVGLTMTIPAITGSTCTIATVSAVGALQCNSWSGGALSNQTFTLSQGLYVPPGVVLVEDAQRAQFKNLIFGTGDGEYDFLSAYQGGVVLTSNRRQGDTPISLTWRAGGNNSGNTGSGFQGGLQNILFQRLGSFGNWVTGVNSWDWLWQTGQDTVYKTGTVTATNGSHALTGSGTAWTTAMVGSDFTIGAQNTVAGKICNVAGATAATLCSTWPGTTAAGATYQLLGGSAGTLVTRFDLGQCGNFVWGSETPAIQPCNIFSTDTTNSYWYLQRPWVFAASESYNGAVNNGGTGLYTDPFMRVVGPNASGHIGIETMGSSTSLRKLFGEDIATDEFRIWPHSGTFASPIFRITDAGNVISPGQFSIGGVALGAGINLSVIGADNTNSIEITRTGGNVVHNFLIDSSGNGQYNLNDSTQTVAVQLFSTNLPSVFKYGVKLGTGSGAGLYGGQSGGLLISDTNPTITAGGCGGSAAAIQNPNSTASFDIFTGTAPTSAGCTITLPAAAHHWHCEANHTSAISTTNFIIQQTDNGASTTSVTLQLFSDVAAATAPAASDTWRTTCTAN